MKAMILAAGAGTRLRPYTLTTPKPMLPVAGRPTLEWIILWLRYYGIREIVINLHHQPEPVLDHFGDGSGLGVKLTFSVESEILGTAGGVKNVERLLGEPFVLVYGDVLTDMDLGALVDFHHARKGTVPSSLGRKLGQSPDVESPCVTLSLNRAPNPWECGIVAFDGQHRVTRFVEKPPREDIFSDMTNAGVLVVEPGILDYIRPGFSDISHDVLPELLRRDVPVFALPLENSTYLIDMGTPEKYERAQREWPTARARRFSGGNE